jgi:hypothetical protein
MPRATRLWREEIVEQDGWTRTGVVIEHPWEPRQTLWYKTRLPEGWKLSESSDALVLVPLFKAMRAGGPLLVEGEVSPSLLTNLEEYQAIFSCWYRDRFRPVEIRPDKEAEPMQGEPGALVAFTGGIDSSFTVFRHATGKAGRQTESLRAGVFVHGFDIPIEEEDGFAAAADKAEATLATLGIPLVRMATNFMQIEHGWDTMAGAVLASCLTLLQPNARAGLIAGGFTYDQPIIWGAHPLCDPFLSSAFFRTVHDGCGYTRAEKIIEIAQWPAALKNLRVCWASPARDRNCGRCTKCARAILMFRALGLGLPECFEEDISDARIRALPLMERVSQILGRELIDLIEQQQVTGSWVREARRRYYKSVRRYYRGLVADYLSRRTRATPPGRR